jgi:hypothetical protein
MSDPDQPRLLLGLTPLSERQVEEELFAADQPIAILGSAADASELLALSERRHANAVLLAPELPALDAGACARLRSHGLRLIGLALDEHNAHTLDELGVDVTLRPPLTASELAAACREEVPLTTPAPESAGQAGDRSSRSPRSGSVLAVVPASGSPGASECAASLAALADQRWPTLLLELDLLENALALRLGVDPQHGSLLGLVRAHSADGSLRDLLARWTTAGDHGGWPPVLVAPPDPHQHIDELAQPGVIRAALDAAASIYPLVVADVGALLSFPGELPKAVRVHREALLAADAVLLVIGAREEQLRAGRNQLTLLLEELAIKREQLRIAISGLGAPGAGSKHELEAALAPELAELRLAVDAWLPCDGRAATRARRSGSPLALARPRGRYSRAVRGLLDELLLPSQPVPRERKTRLPVPTPEASTAPAGDEEVALPWRS